MESMKIALQQGLHTIKTDFKEKITENIMKIEDIMFNWLMISGECENEEVEVLFKMVIDLWVTIRGFSFASCWIEI